MSAVGEKGNQLPKGNRPMMKFTEKTRELLAALLWWSPFHTMPGRHGAPSAQPKGWRDLVVYGPYGRSGRIRWPLESLIAALWDENLELRRIKGTGLALLYVTDVRALPVVPAEPTGSTGSWKQGDTVSARLYFAVDDRSRVSVPRFSDVWTDPFDILEKACELGAEDLVWNEIPGGPWDSMGVKTNWTAGATHPTAGGTGKISYRQFNTFHGSSPSANVWQIEPEHRIETLTDGVVTAVNGVDVKTGAPVPDEPAPPPAGPADAPATKADVARLGSQIEALAARINS